MNLSETYDVLKQIEDIKRKIKELDAKFVSPYSDVGFDFLYYFWHITIIGSVVLFIYLLVSQFISWKHTVYYDFFSSFGGFMDVIIKSLLIAGAVFLALCTLYLIAKFIFFIINQIRNSSKNAKTVNQTYDDKKKTAEKELEKQKYLLESQLKYSDIPFTYRNYNAVSWMINAYNNKRADNYTDLINLYEQYLQNEKQNKYLRQLQNENSKLKVQIDELRTNKK